jgi:PilZ domain
MSSVDPRSPPIGTEVELMRVGERTPIAMADVSGVNGRDLVLDGCRVVIDAELLTVRWWDDADAAWEARGSVEQSDPTSGRLTTTMVEDWQPAILRRAARVESGRVSVELLTLGGDGRVIRRLQVLCLDVSTLGCRVTGTGTRPNPGDLLQVESQSSTLTFCVDARVVRCAPVAFGGWQAGLEFLPHSASDRAALVAWRDSVADARS